MHCLERLKLCSQRVSARRESESLLRCHDQRAWVWLNILNRPCPKLGSLYIEREGCVSFSNLQSPTTLKAYLVLLLPFSNYLHLHFTFYILHAYTLHAHTLTLLHVFESFIKILYNNIQGQSKSRQNDFHFQISTQYSNLITLTLKQALLCFLHPQLSHVWARTHLPCSCKP